MRNARLVATLVIATAMLWSGTATAQWGGPAGGGVPPRSSGGSGSRAQAIAVGDWYFVPVRIVKPRGWSEQDLDRICAEANRVWTVARIGFSFTVQDQRDGVMSRATFDLNMSGAAGLYTGNGRVQVDPDLTLVARGRVLAHELGHVLELENASDSSRLMGPLADRNKTGIEITRSEIATARAAANKLTR